MHITPREPGLDIEKCWKAVHERDRSKDGTFVFAVVTTGIFCRPSCPARRPRRDHVRFYAANEHAIAAGFRPCLRCTPETARRDELAVDQAIAGLSNPEPLPIADMARHVGFTVSHLQRLFKRATGMSPAVYLRALRRARATDALSGVHSVTEALYAAGYAGPSRFYADNADRLGMTPSVWQSGGRGATIRWTIAETSLGPMLIAATDKGICRLSFAETEADLARRFPHAHCEPGGAALADVVKAVMGVVEQGRDPQTIPLDVRGTAFQEAVWQALQKIPAGETRSYAQIAAAIGKPNAVRAVGSANGANPVAVLVPCHRVVRSDGDIGGYAYGQEIKRELLRRERK